MVEYDDTVTDPRGDDSDIWYASANLNGTIRHNGFWEFQVRARDESGRNEDTLIGILGKLGLRWRQVTMEVGGKFESQDRYDNELDQFHFYFQIVREI